jgi:hypothetical protein
MSRVTHTYVSCDTPRCHAEIRGRSCARKAGWELTEDADYCPTHADPIALARIPTADRSAAYWSKPGRLAIVDKVREMAASGIIDREIGRALQINLCRVQTIRYRFGIPSTVGRGRPARR